jgi:hypothetical protein
MRSHPYEPPPPVPIVLEPLANELSSILPNQRSHLPSPASSTSTTTTSSSSFASYQPQLHSQTMQTSHPFPTDSTNTSTSPGTSTPPAIPLDELDPHTSKPLAPARPKQLRVRVQGRLAAVRSVSTGNLRQRAQAQAQAQAQARRQSQIGVMPGMGVGVEEAWAARAAEAAGLATVVVAAGPSRADRGGEERRSDGSLHRGSVRGKGKGLRRFSRFESGVAGETVGTKKQRPSGPRRSLDGSAEGFGRMEDTDGSDEEEDREVTKRDTQLRGYGIGGAGNIRELVCLLAYLCLRSQQGRWSD